VGDSSSLAPPVCSLSHLELITSHATQTSKMNREKKESRLTSKNLPAWPWMSWLESGLFLQ